ncbi:tetratricopeptide repeat protein [Desulfoluna sp.]|uniref:tetratricopeptide repeat protein n=1 Tax=Desulfoluna sp. TaxID=2045199 RepID=UPI002613ABCA|nr:tetratricopeptide repeat protein [Desulfoluna sp.]
MKHVAIIALTLILSSMAPAWAKTPISRQPSLQAVEAKDRGNRHFENGHYKEAIACYTNAIHADPAFLEAYYNRGLSWHKMKLFYKAIVDFDRALEIRPNAPDILYFRGLTYEATEQFREALADIQTAAHKGSKRAKQYLKTGELKRKVDQLGQKEKTLRAITRNASAETLSRTTRTTRTNNAFGGVTTTTIFSKGDPLYDGPEGIFKQVNHYTGNGVLRQSDTFHHALFSTKNNRSKTISHINSSGTPTLVEHHLTGHNLGKIELFHYKDDGTPTGSEKVTLSQFQALTPDQG